MFLPAFSATSHRQADRTRCASNLRQVGFAAIIYASDQRAFPHVGAVHQLDGDATSSDTPTTFRLLLWKGYLDNPEAWVCSGSTDAYLPIDDPQVRGNLKRWGWNGQHHPTATPNPILDATGDPALTDTTELSYAWTRVPLPESTRSAIVLAGDRDAHAHRPGGPGRNVVFADASVDWVDDEHPRDVSTLPLLSASDAP